MPAIKIYVRCRLVTPLLSSGANQQSLSLRSTGVKSGLRFWWRAFQPLDKGDLYAAEAKLFGSTDQASPFSLRVLNPKFSLWEAGAPVSLTNDPHPWGPGTAYVFFSVFDPFKKDKVKNDGTSIKGHPARIKPINHKDPGKSGRPMGKPACKPEDTPDGKPDGTFELLFHCTRLRDLSQAGDVLCSLWLLENFGGLGGRTRRGAGCFEITDLSINDLSFEEAAGKPEWDDLLTGIPRFRFSTGEHPEKFVHEGLSLIMRRWGTSSRTGEPAHTAYYKSQSRIIVSYSQNIQHPSAMKIMETVGQQMKKFNFTYPHQEAKDMHTALSTESPLPTGFNLTKASKGLPIIYNFSSNFENVYSGPLGKTYTATTVVMDKGVPVKVKDAEGNEVYKEGNSRRSSPLLISCHEKGGIPYAVLCFFPAPLIAENEKIWLKASQGSGKLDTIIDPKPLEDFSFVKELIFKENENKKPLPSAFAHNFQITEQEIKPIRPTITSTPVPSQEKTSPPTSKRPTISKTPGEILRDPVFQGKILVRLSGEPSAKDKYNSWQAKRLFLDTAGEVLEDPGWTVTRKSLQSLSELKIGDLLVGTQNPLNKTRLDNPQKI